MAVPNSITDLAGVVLAAGYGTRLRPLTDLRPKALCPVAGEPMLDHAIERVNPFCSSVAVNASHLAEQVESHLKGRPVHVSLERVPLGSGGAIAQLREWIGTRDVLIHNSDTWLTGDLGRLVAGWDRRRPRLLVTRADVDPDFGPWRFVGVSLLPNRHVASLPDGFSGLYEQVWSAAHRAGGLEFVEADGEVLDTGTPSDYLLANLLANSGRSVVGKGAVVEGRVEESVVWDGAYVGEGEDLFGAIRADAGMTVQCWDRHHSPLTTP